MVDHQFAILDHYEQFFAGGVQNINQGNEFENDTIKIIATHLLGQGVKKLQFHLAFAVLDDNCVGMPFKKLYELSVKIDAGEVL